MILNIVNRVSIRLAQQQPMDQLRFWASSWWEPEFWCPSFSWNMFWIPPKIWKSASGSTSFGIWVMMSHDESCHDVMSHVQMPAAFCDILWLQFHLTQLILSWYNPWSSHVIPYPKHVKHDWTIWTQGILWHCFESDLFRLWSDLQWLLAVAGPEFDSRCFWVVPGRIQSPQSPQSPEIRSQFDKSASPCVQRFFRSQ